MGAAYTGFLWDQHNGWVDRLPRVAGFFARESRRPLPLLTLAQPIDGYFSGYGIFLSSDSVLHWAVALQSGLNIDLSAPMTINRWTHVAGVVNAAQGFAALYIDGVAVASQNFLSSVVSYRSFMAIVVARWCPAYVPSPTPHAGTKSISSPVFCSATTVRHWVTLLVDWMKFEFGAVRNL